MADGVTRRRGLLRVRLIDGPRDGGWADVGRGELVHMAPGGHIYVRVAERAFQYAWPGSGTAGLEEEFSGGEEE